VPEDTTQIRISVFVYSVEEEKARDGSAYRGLGDDPELSTPKHGCIHHDDIQTVGD
jgi:hypothetical protein